MLVCEFTELCLPQTEPSAATPSVATPSEIGTGNQIAKKDDSSFQPCAVKAAHKPGFQRCKMSGKSQMATTIKFCDAGHDRDNSAPAIMPTLFFMFASYGSFLMGPLQRTVSPLPSSPRCLLILPCSYTFTTKSKNPLRHVSKFKLLLSLCTTCAVRMVEVLQQRLQ